MSQVETEIREQPEALERLLRDGRVHADEIAARIRERAPRFVVIAARGSSDNAARYAQYLLGVQNRLVVALAAPSVMTRYASSPSLSDALVIGLSQSGRSPDVVAVVADGRRQGALTIAITNVPDSPLAQAAEYVLALHAGEERAVAATKTYTAQLMALAMLSTALEPEPDRRAELVEVPDRLRRALALNPQAPELASRFRANERAVVVARGYDLATAFEIALKIKETSYVMAEPYSSADLLHGPAALLDAALPMLVVAPGAQRFEDLDAVVALARQRGAPLIALSDDEALLAQADAALRVPPGTPDWLSPLVTIGPGQLWALGLARARGLEPDAPRGLSKVTLTR
jgi:glucosamine--fructose-6-phosphate aminotransferase (isomerizing)